MRQPARICTQPLAAEEVRGVVDGAKVPSPSSEIKIAHGELVAPNSGAASGVISVVVILMDSDNGFRCVNERYAGAARFPDQPLIPENPAYDKGREVTQIEAARERKIVDPTARALISLLKRKVPDVGRPVRDGKLSSLSIELELKDRMPKERLGLELPKSRVPTSAIAADRINVSVLVRGQTATRLPHTTVAPVRRRAKVCQQPEIFASYASIHP